MTLHAKFQNGVFKPTELVELPENCDVEIELRVIQTPSTTLNEADALNRIYETMSHRYHTGQADLAERHNEHQP